MDQIPFTVVIPAYNESSRLPKTLERLKQWEPKEFIPLTILIVDDGSTDSTIEVVKQYARQDSRLHLVAATHGGAMHALTTGYKAAKNDWVGNMEADCSTDPAQFERLAPFIGKSDVINGSRILRGGLPPIEGKSMLRRFLSWGMSTLFRVLFRCGVRDPQIGFKIFRKKVLDDVLPIVTSQHDGIKCAELVVKAHGLGYKVSEVPVLHHHDSDSRLVPKNPLGVALNAFAALFKLWADTGAQYRMGIFKICPVRAAWLASIFSKLPPSKQEFL